MISKQAMTGMVFTDGFYGGGGNEASDSSVTRPPKDDPLENSTPNH